MQRRAQAGLESEPLQSGLSPDAWFAHYQASCQGAPAWCHLWLEFLRNDDNWWLNILFEHMQCRNRQLCSFCLILNTVLAVVQERTADMVWHTTSHTSPTLSELGRHRKSVYLQTRPSLAACDPPHSSNVHLSGDVIWGTREKFLRGFNVKQHLRAHDDVQYCVCLQREVAYNVVVWSCMGVLTYWALHSLSRVCGLTVADTPLKFIEIFQTMAP